MTLRGICKKALSLIVFTGDIKIVGALGDHLISGTGALANSITNAGEEFRGVSFATGKHRFEGNYFLLLLRSW